MLDAALTNSPIVNAYRERTPGSASLAEQGNETFPSGITHDARRILPYNIYTDRAEGSRKWDVDGNEYVDYFGGHGALILGHGNADVVAAVQAQMAKGTHFGASHPLELQWGGLVKEMVPCAEKVRFTSSGTEANLMALRLARAYTGKTKFVRFLGHFHGWQDHVAFAADSHFDGTAPTGILKDIAQSVLIAPPNDLEATRAIIEGDDDIAAVIIEPTGASWGAVPVHKEFVAALREITAKRGIVFIMDEVVTGFRVSPGGAQAHYGITPDLTSLAKILAGGLPGGAVCGKREILDLLDFDITQAKGVEKIAHQGTYNANPLSAAAGVAALTQVRDTDACARANAQGAKLRGMLNDVIAEAGISWACYGEYSGFFIFLNPQGLPITPRDFDPFAYDYTTFKEKSPVLNKLRLGLLVHGVDVMGKPGGSVSAVHTDADLEKTAEALARTIAMLKAEENLG